MGSGTGGGVGEQLTQNTLGWQSGQNDGVGVGDGVVGVQLTQKTLGLGNGLGVGLVVTHSGQLS